MKGGCTRWSRWEAINKFEIPRGGSWYIGWGVGRVLYYKLPRSSIDTAYKITHLKKSHNVRNIIQWLICSVYNEWIPPTAYSWKVNHQRCVISTLVTYRHLRLHLLLHTWTLTNRPRWAPPTAKHTVRSIKKKKILNSEEHIATDRYR